MPSKLTWTDIAATGLEIGEPGLAGVVVINEAQKDPSIFLMDLLEACNKAEIAKNEANPEKQQLNSFSEPVFGTPVLNEDGKTYTLPGSYAFRPNIQLARI